MRTTTHSPLPESVATPASATPPSTPMATLNENRLITFPQGLVGFQSFTSFSLSRLPGAEHVPYLLLRSELFANIAYYVADPALLGLELKDADREVALAETGMNPATTQFLVILNLHRDATPPHLTANLKAPLLIDVATLQGQQVILTSKAYTTQHKL